jgi:uncharacterized protein (DUF362 family)
MKRSHLTRRRFFNRGLVFAAGTPLLGPLGEKFLFAASDPSPVRDKSGSSGNSSVSIVRCRSYGPEVHAALEKSFNLLGGIGSLVKNKTVTVKLNLTGTNFAPFLGRAVGETFMTHYSTAVALASILFREGARRVRFVESTQSKSDLRASLALADWDVKALEALGRLEFENTRNLGGSKNYAHVPVPSGGYMFSSFELNRSYVDTDVMVSLAKLKNHVTAGVTLSMKNLFGITPNSLYGAEAGSEDATEGRGPLHNPTGFEKVHPPGLKSGITEVQPTWRVPRITADVCGARPIHLSIIDGITAMKGGEGPWCGGEEKLHFTSPGVIICGLNPVSTDAVATAVMGYENPRAAKGTKPFESCDNHLLLAEEAGLGSADLGRIDVRGLSVAAVRYPYS